MSDVLIIVFYTTILFEIRDCSFELQTYSWYKKIVV